MNDLSKSKRRYLFRYLPIYFLLQEKLQAIAFIDPTSIAVCHNKRIRRNKVFKNLAQRGKTTTGWFYGFKLHLIINDKGEILAFQLTFENVSDVSMVETLSQGILGKLFDDKGYISAEIPSPKGIIQHSRLIQRLKRVLIVYGEMNFIII